MIQLLREGVDVNCAAGLNGETALMAAAVCGNVDILTILLSCAALTVNQGHRVSRTLDLKHFCMPDKPYKRKILYFKSYFTIHEYYYGSC